MFGFLSDFFVLGVIDEVARRDFPSSPSVHRTTTTLKRPATSPLHAKVPPELNTLDNYFASTSIVESGPADHDLILVRSGYMLSDSKSRSVNSTPPKDASRGSRLQLMVYHQLLSALLLSPIISTTPAKPDILGISPFSWERLYAQISLSSTLALCDSFLDQIKALVVDTSLESLLEGSTTLEDFVDVLQRFAEVFRKEDGTVLEREMEICFRLRNHLRYTPRKNNVTRQREFLERNKAEKERIQQACLVAETEELELAKALKESLAMSDTQVEKELTPVFSLPSIEMDKDLEEPGASLWDLPTNSQATPVTPHRHDTRLKRRIISLDNERLTSPVAIALPPTSVSATSFPTTPPPAFPPADETHLTKGSIIGTDQFTMDESELSDWLRGIVALWKGEKEPEGVSIENASRCRTCEFEEGCEWRFAKAKEHAVAWESKRSSGKKVE